MKKRLFAAVLCCLMVLLCACAKQEEDASGSKLTPKTIQEYKEMVEAMRNVIPKENVLMEDASETVFGSEYGRNEITAVYFRDTLKKSPKSSWDVSRDGSGKVKAWVQEVSGELELYIAGEGGVRAPESCREMFAGYSQVKVFDFGTRFDTSAAVDMYGMFRDCSGFDGTLDLSTFQTAGVTDMGEMFSGMNRVQKIDLSVFDTSNVTNMSGMFREYSGESLDLSGFDTAKVTDMHEMFSGCQLEVLDLQSFSTTAVTDMREMFSGCTRLEELNISSFRTGNVTTMAGMFESCGLSKFDVNHFNTARVTDMSRLFAGCEQITKLDLTGLDTGEVTTMASMFRGCSSLVTVDVSSFETSNVTDMSGMFYDCNMLDTPDLKNFDTSNVEEYNQFMLSGVEVDGAPWEALFTSVHHLTFN